MHLTKTAIESLERIKRLNIINSISGIKPANLIGTISDKGESNLAIFSSVVHLGSNPALIGFVMRPEQEVRRHTFENIFENGFYTINHIHESFAEQAHYTSAKFEKEESEFKACGLTEEYLFDFKAPFVKESRLKFGLKFQQKVPIEINKTTMIIGSIEHLILPEAALSDEGFIDLGMINNVGISGLNSYYKLEKTAQYPYARKQELPDFKNSKVY